MYGSDDVVGRDEVKDVRKETRREFEKNMVVYLAGNRNDDRLR